MGHRRYLPIGTEPEYDRMYDRLKMSSPIMNANARANSMSYSGDWNDIHFLKKLQLEWQGNEEGLYYYADGRRWVPAKIPDKENQLVVIEKEFKKYQQRIVNEGNPRPDKMLSNEHVKKVRLEAYLDIYKEDLDVISQKILELEDKEEEVDDSKVLFKGPRGHKSLRNNIPDIIDGQKCGLSDKGVVIIKDPKSPYHGMLCADYIGFIVKPWVTARIFLDKQYHKLQGELGIYDTKNPDLQKAWKERNEQLYDKYPDKIWKDLFALKLDGKPNMPSWPEGIKNHLENERK